MDLTRLRIEDYAWFFQDDTVLDLSDRINALDIESEVLPELAYITLKSGYKKYDYEEKNGRGEFNTESIRTTINKVDTEFDNVSDIRADTMGILKLLGQEIGTTGTTDSKGDNELFITKTQRTLMPGGNLKLKKILRLKIIQSIFGRFNL